MVKWFGRKTSLDNKERRQLEPGPGQDVQHEKGVRNDQEQITSIRRVEVNYPLEGIKIKENEVMKFYYDLEELLNKYTGI